MFHRRIFLSLSCLLLCANCTTDLGGSSPADPEAPAFVEVSLSLDSNSVAILDVLPVSADPRERIASVAQTTRALRYELRDTKGDLIAAGTMPDPFVVRSELDVEGELDPHTLILDESLSSLAIPNVSGELSIFDASGVLSSVSMDHRDLDDLGVRSSALIRNGDVLGEAVQIGGGGPGREAAVSILMVSDGYTEAELGKFHADTSAFIEDLRITTGIRRHWPQIAVFRQDVRSRESGANADTAFETRRDATSGIITAYGQEAQRSTKLLGDLVNANVVVVVANVSGRASSFGVGSRILTLGGDALHAGTFAHELGHAIFGLADEYVNGTGCDFAGRQYLWPNIAVSLEHIPWSDLLTTSELPTSFTGENRDAVGAFDRRVPGCGFRPAHRSNI